MYFEDSHVRHPSQESKFLLKVTWSLEDRTVQTGPYEYNLVIYTALFILSEVILRLKGLAYHTIILTKNLDDISNALKIETTQPYANLPPFLSIVLYGVNGHLAPASTYYKIYL